MRDVRRDFAKILCVNAVELLPKALPRLEANLCSQATNLLGDLSHWKTVSHDLYHSVLYVFANGLFATAFTRPAWTLHSLRTIAVRIMVIDRQRPLVPDVSDPQLS